MKPIHSVEIYGNTLLLRSKRFILKDKIYTEKIETLEKVELSYTQHNLLLIFPILLFLFVLLGFFFLPILVFIPFLYYHLLFTQEDKATMILSFNQNTYRQVKQKEFMLIRRYRELKEYMAYKQIKVNFKRGR